MRTKRAVAAAGRRVEAREGSPPLSFLPPTSFSAAFPGPWAPANCSPCCFLNLSRNITHGLTEPFPPSGTLFPWHPNGLLSNLLQASPSHGGLPRAYCSSFKPGPSSPFTVSTCLLQWSSGTIDTYSWLSSFPYIQSGRSTRKGWACSLLYP